MRPTTIVKAARRRALRRRYGYAALRELRRGLARARREHERRSVSPAKYDSERDAMRAEYRRALRALYARWPALDMADPRAVYP